MKSILSIPYHIIPRKDFSEEFLELEKSAIECAYNAYSPYSRFNVGAAIRLQNGKIIVGSNQENAAYPSGLCAERTALFYAGANFPSCSVTEIMILAYNKNKKKILRAFPCGSCRQVLLETSNRYHQDIRIILPSEENAFVFDNIQCLLPFAFEAESLQQK